MKFGLYNFLKENPGFPKLVWKNLFIEPGFYKIEVETVIVTKETLGEGMFSDGHFNPSSNTIVIKNFVTKSAQLELQEHAAELNSHITLSLLHELGHRNVAKYSCSYFFGKLRNYKIGISDEIARHAEQIIGFAKLQRTDREKYKHLDSFEEGAHWKIISLPYFRNRQFSDIYDSSYIEEFNKVGLSVPGVMDIIMECAIKKFKTVFNEYVDGIYELSKLSDKITSVDFYHWPVSYKTAKKKIFNTRLRQGKEIVNLLDSMSDDAKKNLDSNITYMAKEIKTNR